MIVQQSSLALVFDQLTIVSRLKKMIDNKMLLPTP